MINITKNTPYTIKFTAIISLIIALIAGAYYAICLEPNQVSIHDVWIKDENLARVFKGKIFIQLSDLHIKSFGSREKTVLDIVKRLNPDIIVLTGDYVQWHRDYSPALDFLSKLQARDGVWAVMGDYDYSNSRKSCLFCHKKGSGTPPVRHNIHFLRDSSEILKTNEGAVVLAGITGEDPDSEDVRRTLSSVQDNTPLIILCHNPLIFDLLPNERHILMLAGDTHGGQIPLPGWIFGLLGYEKNARYNQGLFEDKNKKMFVSRGIGWSHLPIRFDRPPEVAVLHFVR